MAEFAAKENLKLSFPLRFKARRAEGGVDIRVEHRNTISTNSNVHFNRTYCTHVYIASQLQSN